MNWNIKYSAPPNLSNSINSALSGKPIAAVHDMVRKVVNNSQNQQNTIRSIIDDVLMELLNSPIFADYKRAIIGQDESLKSLRSQIKKIVYRNMSLEKVPHYRRTIPQQILIPISQGNEWMIILDSRALDQLVNDYGQDNVKVIERNLIDLRLVRIDSSNQNSIADETLLDLFNSNGFMSFKDTSHFDLLDGIWSENQMNQATYHYDRVRHYCPKFEREKEWKLENRVGRKNSFEQHTPVNGWETTEAILISNPAGDVSYGLCYNPSLDFWYGTKGWSLTKWVRNSSGSVQAPEIRHIGKVNGLQVDNSSFVFELMRLFRSCVWKVDIAEFLSGDFLDGYDLPYLKDNPIITQTYWVEVAKAIYEDGDQNGGIDLCERILNSCGWRVK
tara:strand:- start:1896 stop:3059 length:1164 start_codon:yes stop_codon:yes gene_type:complete